MQYRIRDLFSINVGFTVCADDVAKAVELTNGILGDLPSRLYRTLDYKTISSIVGAIFCESLASHTEGEGIVNPIEKGHPDLVPASATNATEEQLRNYPIGLEVKCTIGNVAQGANLRAGEQRVKSLTGITWQAHHREVRELMGISWDFVELRDVFRFPSITGVFYSANLIEEDWGTISGTTGRNTKVTGMCSSGKEKMGGGWVVVLDDEDYITAFRKFLKRY